MWVRVVVSIRKYNGIERFCWWHNKAVADIWLDDGKCEKLGEAPMYSLSEKMFVPNIAATLAIYLLLHFIKWPLKLIRCDILKKKKAS